MSRPVRAALVSVSATELTSAEKRLLEEYNPLGVSLFNRNIATPQQLQKLIADIKETLNREDALIAVDQEGGRVRRLREPDFRAYAGQQTLGRLYTEVSPAAAQKAVKIQAALIAADLHSLGINLNYAPVLDVRSPQTAPVLSSRIFSDTPQIVAELGKIMADEYMAQNIIPCIKHLPGHGRAAVDPHLHLPVITAALPELENDFYPFKQLHRLPCGMTAHIVVAAVDDSAPVTQSPKAVRELIRGQIGFDGFLISDAIDMRALKGSLSEKTITALNAGCDAVCYCAGESNGLEEVCRAARPLTDDALERLPRMTAVLSAPKHEHNITALQEEYIQILGQIEAYDETYDATEVLFKMQQPN